MASVWDDPEWIASELERLAATPNTSGVRVAYRLQLEARAAQLAEAESGAQIRPLRTGDLSAWHPAPWHPSFGYPGRPSPK